jgi:predicted dehydrogenase/threonine dehydrogenase-like Zn-dependent dehydrogenase
LRDGKLLSLVLPSPIAGPGELVVANNASVISAGTERMAAEVTRKSLLGKARNRPDQVKRVLQKIVQEGWLSTFRQVQARLDEPLTLGYSSAGVVLECGSGVEGFRPGDRVASNGPHAGVVAVPRNLCAHIAESVPLDQAAFAVLGAIALQGVRLARCLVGETVFVIGLGLIGQLTVALARASGCRVLGTDPDPARCALAVRMGTELARPGLAGVDVAAQTGGHGADAVLIAAAADSRQPMDLAVEAVRQKGRIVLVGVVALELDRRPFYFKECEFVVSSSYGPGRYDPEYEERGHDYPYAYVRWTEQRNLQAVLDLMASGRLDVAPLISHRFPIEQADKAYELIEKGGEPFMGVVLEYQGEEAPLRRLELRTGSSRTGAIGVGVFGAGSFARTTMIPAIRRVDSLEPRVLCSGGGLSAATTGEKHGFAAVTTDETALLDDSSVRAVFVLTRHNQHARQVVAALRARKHVFVEKPLVLTMEELSAVEEALASAPDCLLTVGFNRRFSPIAARVKAFFADCSTPLTASIRFNAGAIPPEHWTQNAEEGGGRIIGEACHGIDLATFLVGAPPVRVFAESIGGSTAPEVTDDQCFITLRHANGSVSSVAYLAGGDRAFEKERVEVIGGGRVAVIQDYRTMVTIARGRTQRKRAWQQDKGHQAEITAFARAIASGGPAPIPWVDLRAVSLAAILAVRSLREGIPFEIPTV